MPKKHLMGELSPLSWRRGATAVIIAAFAIVGFLLVGATPTGAQVGPSNLQSELDAARLRWAETKPEVYEIRAQVGCSRMCFGYPLWHNSITTRYGVGDPRYGPAIDERTGDRAPSITVEQIFNKIQTAIDDDWYGISVRSFDPVTGVPSFARFDPESYYDESDEGFVSVLEIIDRTEAMPGAMAAEEVGTAVSCLANRGRVDVNIVNTTLATARYRIEFDGLTAREYSLEPNAIWRMPFTGRPDGTYDLNVWRDGFPVSVDQVNVGCRSRSGTTPSPEVQVVNGCRRATPGGGEVRFQFVNPTNETKPYVIDFSSRPRRSTTAVAYGQAIRAVNGLANGQYAVRITSGSTVVDQFIVNVACPSG